MLLSGLVVSPRVCEQTRLEESLKQQVDLQQALDTAEKENQDEKEKNKKTKMEWECEREAMREEIVKLRENLRHKCGMLNTIEGKHNVRTASYIYLLVQTHENNILFFLSMTLQGREIQ